MGLKIASLSTPKERTPQRLSLCMIMRDEEEHLARCLESVQGVADEIVIVDTGSVDRSVEIAESFGARVLHEEWKGDFAAPRNTGIDAATGDWILILDADEELVDGAKACATCSTTSRWRATASARSTSSARSGGSRASSTRRSGSSATGRPTGTAGPCTSRSWAPSTPRAAAARASSGIEIHHYGYLEPTSRAKEKTDRNMAIVMEEVARKPLDSFTLFNAGVEFQRVGRMEEALDYFTRSFRELNSLKAYYASLLLRNIVATLHSLERWDEALDVLADALQAYPDFTDLHYLQGQVHTARREYRAATKSFRRAIELGDHGGDRYLAQAGMGSFYSWHALGVLHEMMGDVAEAVRCQRNAIREARGHYGAPVVRLTRLLLQTDPPLTVREYMSSIIAPARREESLRAVADVLLHEDHAEHALAVLVEARELRPDDGAIALTMADALIRLGDLDGARAQLDGIAPGTSSHQLAHAKRVLVGLIADDPDAVRAAIDELRPVADGLYATAYELALAAATDPAGAVPELPAGADRAAALDAVMELAATLLGLGRARHLQRDGAAALRRRRVAARRGRPPWVPPLRQRLPGPGRRPAHRRRRGGGRHPRRPRRARAHLPVEAARRGRRGVPAGRPGAATTRTCRGTSTWRACSPAPAATPTPTRCSARG